MDARPQIREEIEALPVAESGGSRFVLYDRSGVSEAQLAVPAAAMFLIARLDGKTSLLDVLQLYERETNEQLPLVELEQIVAALDQALFLNNAAFQTVFETLRAEFLATTARPAVCAGSAYPAEPEELRALLDRLLQTAPPVENEGRVSTIRRPAPRGVIAPHMDFQRAAGCYGQVYRELAGCTPPMAVAILGTAHQPIRNRYALCAKDFAVPGGIVRHEPKLCTLLQEHCRISGDFSADILAHRFEHSVELQTVWLRHIWGEGVRIVPLLAGSPAEYLSHPADAAADRQIAALAEILRDFSRRGVMLLASADLAHIGPRFGDERRIEKQFLAEVAAADRSYLQTAAEGTAEETLCAFAAQNDRYRLCGTGCIYALKQALPGVRGRLLGYQQAVTAELEQAVTCAGMIFE